MLNLAVPETVMPVRLHSPWLGEIEWEPVSELCFPHGLPGFEDRKRLVPVEIPSQRPLIYLQSADKESVCFLTLPVLTVNPAFELRLSEDDRSLLGLDCIDLPPAVRGRASPNFGNDILCLALLVPSGRTVKTNLDAPIVVNLHTGLGIQAVAPEPRAGSFRLAQNGEWERVC
jgi:flagellar assembly factor FliW